MTMSLPALLPYNPNQQYPRYPVIPRPPPSRGGCSRSMASWAEYATAVSAKPPFSCAMDFSDARDVHLGCASPPQLHPSGTKRAAPGQEESGLVEYATWERVRRDHVRRLEPPEANTKFNYSVDTGSILRIDMKTRWLLFGAPPQTDPYVYMRRWEAL